MNPLISAVVAVTIVIASTVIVVNTVTPISEQTKSLNKLNSAKQTLNDIDSTIKNLALEAPGAKRSLVISSDLPVTVSGSLDKVFIRFGLDKPLFQPGTRIKEGPVTITSGPITDAYTEDINNDGLPDYVMENDYVMFAIKEIGSSSSYQPINTSNIVSYVRDKRNSVVMTPKETGIFINDILNSSAGVGYTKLVRGSTSVGILVHVVSDANINYTAVFTLRPKVDFVEMHVRDIEI